MAVVEMAPSEVAAAVTAVPFVPAVATVPRPWRLPADPCDRTCGPRELPTGLSDSPAAILPAQSSSLAFRAFQGKVMINFYFLAWVLLYSLRKLRV